MTAIASLSIAARATLDMHSLNNEGGEGNQIQTRMVDIYGPDGQMYNVNAISGDMLKRIQAQHFYELAREQHLPLCKGCITFNANRINADAEWIAQIANQTYREALTSLLQTCALDDTAGILITEGKKSLPRKSVVEFGWVVGVPKMVKSESYFHVKYAQERNKDRIAEDASARDSTGSNLGQSIFHRPASSGIYAIVCHIELGRIGYNDISQDYVLDEAERTRRARALIQSVLHTFVELNGAMRTTQLPHLVGLQGAITYSRSGAIPAPLMSPLQDDYREQTKEIATALASTSQNVEYSAFDTLGDFAKQMSSKIEGLQLGSLVPR